MLPELNRAEFQRYSRHLLIPEVGLAGQRKLNAAAALLSEAEGYGSTQTMNCSFPQKPEPLGWITQTWYGKTLAFGA